MSRLFEPIKLRRVTARNRVFVSPMCQYSCVDGIPGDWHLAHLGARAAGGAGLVIAEATAVVPEGRISPADSGLWSEKHADAWGRVARFIKAQGAVPAIQLAHAGRKASTPAPWDGGTSVSPENGGWTPLGPTDRPFDAGSPTPKEMTVSDVAATVAAFARGCVLARRAGFEAVELHFAHGYLVHSFLSPLVNTREDGYGGDRDNRMRLAVEIATAARRVWPSEFPLLARISATDWAPGGWDLPDSIELCRRLKEIGVDLIDCSSGGAVPGVKIPAGPGYQVPFSEAIRRETGVATGAVGFITEPAQAEEIVASGKADAVLLARQLLREPSWPLRAAKELGADVEWPKQYLRAKR